MRANQSKFSQWGARNCSESFKCLTAISVREEFACLSSSSKFSLCEHARRAIVPVAMVRLLLFVTAVAVTLSGTRASVDYSRKRQCTRDFDRCAGARGKPYVFYAPCCSKEYSCVEKRNNRGQNWGHFCLPYGYPDARLPAKCYKIGERCAGASRKQYVPYLPCCDQTAACTVHKVKGWGLFCEHFANGATNHTKPRRQRHAHRKFPYRLNKTAEGSAPLCYGANERCMGSTGKPYVPYRRCCDLEFSCAPPVSGDWGHRCKRKSYVAGNHSQSKLPAKSQKSDPHNQYSAPRSHPGHGLNEHQYAHGTGNYHSQNSYAHADPRSTKKGNGYGYDGQHFTRRPFGYYGGEYWYPHGHDQSPSVYPGYPHWTPTLRPTTSSTSRYSSSRCTGDRRFCKASHHESLAINAITFVPIPISPNHVTLKAVMPCSPCGETSLRRSDLGSAAAKLLLEVACNVAHSLKPTKCAFNSIETGSIDMTFTFFGVQCSFGVQLAKAVQASLEPFAGSITVSVLACLPPSPSPPS
jgi:hypothetical protein